VPVVPLPFRLLLLLPLLVLLPLLRRPLEATTTVLRGPTSSASSKV